MLSEEHLTLGTVMLPWGPGKSSVIFQLQTEAAPIHPNSLTVREQDVAHLGRGAVELQQSILQPLHLGFELFSIPVQKDLVESDELQKGLRSCIVVVLLIAQVRLGCLVDTCVDKGHKFAN